MKDAARRRYAPGSGGHAVIRGCPNGETRPVANHRTPGGDPTPPGGNRANWTISVARGEEINRDSPSSGERTGSSPEPSGRRARGPMPDGSWKHRPVGPRPDQEETRCEAPGEALWDEPPETVTAR